MAPRLFINLVAKNSAEIMKKFQAITRKVVSIKTFTRRYSYVDDEILNGTSLDVQKQSRDALLAEVMFIFQVKALLQSSLSVFTYSFSV